MDRRPVSIQCTEVLDRDGEPVYNEHRFVRWMW